MNLTQHSRRRRRRRQRQAHATRFDMSGMKSSGITDIALRSILLITLASQVVVALVFESHCPNRLSPYRKCNEPLSTSHCRHHEIRVSMSAQGGDWGAAMQQPDAMEELTKQTIEELMIVHDPILLFASKLLPQDKAQDASALYAWCRRLDEICDNDEDIFGNKNLVIKNLGLWEERFEALWTTSGANNNNPNNYPADEYLMDLALKRCIEKYQDNSGDPKKSLLTRVPFDDMIEGMKSDTAKERRIQNMEELERYAYQVAGTVGLMLLPLLLSENNTSDNTNNRVCNEQTLRKIEEAREPAICLGKAIQLVNILRDATQDAKLGRIYLPRNMLCEEGVDEELILELGLNPSSSGAPQGYKNVVKRVSVRALELLANAETGKDTLPAPLGPVFVQIIVELYRDYLDELDRRDYDNLTTSSGEDRVKISTLRKAKASLRAVVKVFGEAVGLRKAGTI